MLVPTIIVVSYVVRKYFRGPKFTEKVDGRRLVAIVTGGNGAIGRELIRELVARNVKVYLICRSDEKGRHASFVIRYYNGFDYNTITHMCCDLSDFQSIRRFVNEFNRKEQKLDILINNAGIMPYSDFEQTIDGHELIWQTNYLGHFLLTELLLPKLKKSTVGGRIINQSSDLHLYADTVDATVVNAPHWYSRLYKSYARSKLAQVMHAVALTKKIRSEDIESKLIVNACHPGYVNSNLVQIPIIQYFLSYALAPFLWYFMKTSGDGAQTAIYLALSKQMRDISGKYFSDCQFATPHPLVFDQAACDKLYNESREACGLLEKDDIVLL